MVIGGPTNRAAWGTERARDHGRPCPCLWTAARALRCTVFHSRIENGASPSSSSRPSNRSVISSTFFGFFAGGSRKCEWVARDNKQRRKENGGVPPEQSDARKRTSTSALTGFVW